MAELQKALVLPIDVVETAQRKRIAASEDCGYEVPAPVLNPFTVTDRHLASSGNFFPTVKAEDPNPYRGLSGPEILRKMVEKADADGKPYQWGR